MGSSSKTETKLKGSNANDQLQDHITTLTATMAKMMKAQKNILQRLTDMEKEITQPKEIPPYNPQRKQVWN